MQKPEGWLCAMGVVGAAIAFLCAFPVRGSGHDLDAPDPAKPETTVGCPEPYLRRTYWNKWVCGFETTLVNPRICRQLAAELRKQAAVYFKAYADSSLEKDGVSSLAIETSFFKWLDRVDARLAQGPIDAVVNMPMGELGADAIASEGPKIATWGNRYRLVHSTGMGNTPTMPSIKAYTSGKVGERGQLMSQDCKQSHGARVIHEAHPFTQIVRWMFKERAWCKP